MANIHGLFENNKKSQLKTNLNIGSEEFHAPSNNISLLGSKEIKKPQQ